MFQFAEISRSSRRYLSISSDEDTSGISMLELLSLPPLVGFYAPRRNNNSIHRDNAQQWSTRLADAISLVQPSVGITAWIPHSPSYLRLAESVSSSTIGRNILSGSFRWGGIFRLRGEFSYIPKYWEWLADVVSRDKEVLTSARILDAIYSSRYSYDRNLDIIRAFCEAWCPKFNVLETSTGAVSISLWDLYKLGGLSIYGDLYEETVPCVEELTGSLDQNRFLPRSCEFLFSAFYLLQREKKSVNIVDWISFWYKGAMEYPRPPKRVVKNVNRPKSSHNPNTPIGARPWSCEDEAVFDKQRIKGHLRPLTYSSAFISCWLCAFVFPQADGLIRPETFKVASLMASGKCFNLAVPVLASIYRGLNDISHSSSAASNKSCFPAHYLYGWMACYLGTHYPVPDEVDGPPMVKYSGEGGALYYDERAARTHTFWK